MTEQQQPNPQPNNDGAGAGNQPDGGATEHGAAEPKIGETSHPQKTEGAPAGNEQPPEGSPPAPKKHVIPKEYKLKMPEGMEPNEKYIQSVAAYAKKHRLSNEQAQAVLNRDINLRASIVNRQREELDKQMSGWMEAAKSDSEIGGEKFDESISIAKRVVQKFATPGFIDGLNQTGLGNHPEVIRFFYRLGKSLKDDSFVHPGSGAPAGNRSLEEVFYGDSKK